MGRRNKKQKNQNQGCSKSLAKLAGTGLVVLALATCAAKGVEALGLEDMIPSLPQVVSIISESALEDTMNLPAPTYTSAHASDSVIQKETPSPQKYSGETDVLSTLFDVLRDFSKEETVLSSPTPTHTIVPFTPTPVPNTPTPVPPAPTITPPKPTITPEPAVTSAQANVSQIPERDIGYVVDSACKIAVASDVLNGPNGRIVYSGTLKPNWRVDIDRLTAVGTFGEKGYELWARINVNGPMTYINDNGITNYHLKKGWFKTRTDSEIFSLCGEWLFKGENVNKVVTERLRAHPEIALFTDNGDGTYRVSFNSQEEAMQVVYALSENNHDPSVLDLIQPYQQQQQDLGDAAVLNVLWNDRDINKDTIKARFDSRRYHGVIYGVPFSNLYQQAVEHWWNVTVSYGSISPDRVARVRAIIALEPTEPVVTVLPQGYIYIINPPYDGVNMPEALNMDGRLCGPVGLHFFGKNS